MLTALFILTFITGLFFGVILLGTVLAILVKRDERHRRNPYLSEEIIKEKGVELRGSKPGKNPFV